MIENNFGKHYVLCPGMILWQSENSYYPKDFAISSPNLM